MTISWAAAARLVRRTGFGATGSDVDAVVREGAAAYVERILAADPQRDPGALATPAPQLPYLPPGDKNADPAARRQFHRRLREQDAQLVGWWLRRMVAVRAPFAEKNTFGWHAHFATSLKKVRQGSAMLAQNEQQRLLGLGDFRALAYAMLTDTATIRWLDGEKNTAQGPNENLSREFMEIFTLGHADGYTEQDVREGARALTGWRIDRNTGLARFVERFHDDSPKTIFGATGDFGTTQFCDAVLARPGCAPFVVTKLWNFYVSDAPPPKDVLGRLLAAYGPRRDLRAALRAMLTDPAFTAAANTKIVGPVEWMLGAIRTLHVAVSDARTLRQMAGSLDALGQLPFFPPSVGGWPSGHVWLSTAAADLRFGIAAQLAGAAQIPALTGSTTSRLEALAHLLGVASWSPASLAVLKGSAADQGQLLAVALNTPEYLVH